MTMQQRHVNCIEWTKRFFVEDACRVKRGQLRWSASFRVLELSCKPKRQGLWQFANCLHPVSSTVGTLFGNSQVTQNQLFDAILLMTSDNGGICAVRPMKMVEMTWHTAQRLLLWSRQEVGYRDEKYLLRGLIEMTGELGIPDVTATRNFPGNDG